MTDEREQAWAELHDALPPGWQLGRRRSPKAAACWKKRLTAAIVDLIVLASAGQSAGDEEGRLGW